MFGELPTDRASLFGPQVQRLILLPLKKEEKENKWLEKSLSPPPKGRGKKKQVIVSLWIWHLAQSSLEFNAAPGYMTLFKVQ